jgi:hypothetical protein
VQADNNLSGSYGIAVPRAGQRFDSQLAELRAAWARQSRG